jgi:hypothetical protein
MLYILSPLPLILLGISGNPIIGLVFLFVFVAAATGLLIYNGMSNPKYLRNDDTMVEEFKEWQSEKAGKHSIRGQISGAVWSITIALYFIISFSYNCWAVSWIIFLVAVAAEQVINALIALKNNQ